ncbi:hypothetical protein [Streptomyces sp. SD15]
MEEQAREPVGVVGERAGRPWTRHLWVFCRNVPFYAAGVVVLHFLTGLAWLGGMLYAAAFAVSEPYFQYRRDRRRAGAASG